MAVVNKDKLIDAINMIEVLPSHEKGIDVNRSMNWLINQSCWYIHRFYILACGNCNMTKQNDLLCSCARENTSMCATVVTNR